MNKYNFPTEIPFLVEIGITQESCRQFLYDHNDKLIFNGHSYTSDGQVWILYDTKNDVHANVRVGSTDHDGNLLRDLLEVDISDMLAYIRNKKIDSIIK